MRLLKASLLLAVAAAALAAAAPAWAAKGPKLTAFAGPVFDAQSAGVSPQSDALAFFPSSLTIRAGQSITWHIHGFHTVTFAGTMTNPPFVVPHPELPQAPVNDAAGTRSRSGPRPTRARSRRISSCRAPAALSCSTRSRR
jgi:plastocyanin